MSSSCSVSTSSLFLVGETLLAFHCNQIVKLVWTISLDKKEWTTLVYNRESLNQLEINSELQGDCHQGLEEATSH